MAQVAAERAQSREQNLTIDGNRPGRDFFKKLDASVKKNTAFVKKLKTTMTESQQKALLSDVEKLNLNRYLEEVTASLAQAGKIKNASLETSVALAVSLHRRYEEFADGFKTALETGLALPDVDDKEAVVCHRFTFKLYSEMVLLGVFPLDEGKVLCKRLAQFLSKDKEYQHLATAVSLLAFLVPQLAGALPRSQQQLLAKHEVEVKVQPVFEELAPQMQELLKRYFKKLSDKLVNDKTKLNQRIKQDEVTMDLKGELLPERAEATAKAKTNFDDFLGHVTQIADIVDEDMPALPEPEEDDMMNGVKLDMTNPYKSMDPNDVASSLWQDVEEQEFYEHLPDLMARLPEVLFASSKKQRRKLRQKQEAEQADKHDKDDKDDDKDDGEDDDDATSPAPEEDEVTEDMKKLVEGDGDMDDGDDGDLEAYDAETAKPDTEAGAAPDNFTVFAEKLPTCVNKAFIDKASEEFCYLNTTGTRRRLVETLFYVERMRLDLLPFYARMVATLQPGMPDVGEQLIERLEGEFRFLTRKHPTDRIESKTKNVRFIGELVKFRVCPAKVAIRCIQVLVRLFRGQHVETLCQLLDTCGRFLYRSPDTHVRTKYLLEIMMKKKANLHDERYHTMLANSFYYCNPPEKKAIEAKVRPPLHDYIRKLLYKDLRPKAAVVQRILEKCRKMPWDDKEFFFYGVKCFTRVWFLKFHHIPALASLLAALRVYQEGLAYAVIDATLEEIRVCMEINTPDMNQRRISTVKFLGELFNFKLVDSRLVFNTLYSLITFAAHDAYLDPPQHCFRIKLVCVLLDACGHFFNEGADKRRLDSFLHYLQRYVLQKPQLPIGIDFALSDTLEALRPNLLLYETVEEANEVIEQLQQQYLDKLKAKGIDLAQAKANAGLAEVDEDSDSDDDDDDDDEDEEEEAEAAVQAAPQGDYEELVFWGEAEEAEPDVDDEAFVNDYAKLMNDMTKPRAARQAPVLDVAVPMHLKGKGPKEVETDSGDKRLVLTLLTKKKQQEIHVPAATGMAESMLARQEAELAERQRNKELVMQFDQRATEEAEVEAERGINPILKEQAVVPRTRDLLFNRRGRGRGRGRGRRNYIGPGARNNYRAGRTPAQATDDGSGDKWTSQPVFNPT
eukprot:TRINITY_DN11359_c3_g1_i1.p1 TRINITY_DN11359_c3_g1~~TRINITY_DN11359_c3_g1_i1.p1  ORF type:complete len:1196 (+),score=478.84 TRINITY_DN11359_c3_g1_i1:208-3588(+)